MEERPSYFAVIPAEIRYDNDLRANEKLLYGEITSLAKKTGECWASNKYFSELYGVKPNAIATWIRHLKNKGYIAVGYTYNGKVIDKRIITIGGIQKDNTSYPKRYGGGIQKDNRGGIQKGEENNTNNTNNTSINNKRKYIKEKFKKPTLEEVVDYCKERNNFIDPEQFIDFYESKNWYVGKNKMKDWKACIRTWERRNIKKESIVPDWMDKEIKKEEYDDDTKKLAEAIRRA